MDEKRSNCEKEEEVERVVERAKELQEAAATLINRTSSGGAIPKAARSFLWILTFVLEEDFTEKLKCLIYDGDALLSHS
ncbi:hypothetical protein CUMW_177530 [Citrus unshiu]|uniref:Uncharacterized protein n=1 Tax=Citrus unshiu TaxID=55188 RepID=A0A2H5PXX0_CITUN|nr:hypothetical protein CUMW_177530 [Citrus unshiu]